MPVLVPAGAADGASQRIALGPLVRFGEPGLAHGVDDGRYHRGLLGDVAELRSEVAAKAGGRGSGAAGVAVMTPVTAAWTADISTSAVASRPST